MRRAVFALIAATVLAAAAWAALAQPEALKAEVEPRGYEYAELRVMGRDAVLVTRADAFFFEGPSEQDARTQVKLDNDRIRVSQSILVRHLTRAGADGWEVVERLPGEGPVYLLQRRYTVEPPAAS